MSAHEKGLNRRDFVRTLALGGAALAAGSAWGQAPAVVSRKRPNILMIVSDQERGWLDLPAGLGLNAHELLLEKGVGFTNYNVHTTPCSPSRSEIYCGQHTQLTRMTSNVGAPPFPKLAEVPTIGHLLREQGYYTAYKGKWHLSAVPTGSNLDYGPYPVAENALERFGFADYGQDGVSDGTTWTGFRIDGVTASDAARWLNGKGRGLDQPWFLAVNFVNPHDIVYFDQPDGQQARTRADRDFLAPLSPPPSEGVYTKYWDVPLPKSWYADDLKNKPWAQTSYVDFCNFLYGHLDPKDEERWRHYQSYYFNCIRDVDRHVLTVLQALEAAGLADNTIVLFTADHGDMLGAHGLRQKGPFMYKENVRVPFILRHPDVKGGFTTEALGGPVDIAPTLLGFAGLSEAQRAERYPMLKGVNLAPALAGSSARTERDQRGHLYDYTTTLYIDPPAARTIMENHEKVDVWTMLEAELKHGRLLPDLGNPGLFRGCFDGRYKFARYFKASEHHIPKDWDTLLKHNQLELYDTQADPDEITNLAAEPEKQKELILKLNAQTNALIQQQIGFDDGREQFGPNFLFKL